MYRRTTIPRYMAFQRHWRRHPRVEWLVAGYLGFKPTPEPDARPAAARIPPPTGAIMQLYQSLGGSQGKPAVLRT